MARILENWNLEYMEKVDNFDDFDFDSMFALPTDNAQDDKRAENEAVEEAIRALEEKESKKTTIIKEENKNTDKQSSVEESEFTDADFEEVANSAEKIDEEDKKLLEGLKTRKKSRGKPNKAAKIDEDKVADIAKSLGSVNDNRIDIERLKLESPTKFIVARKRFCLALEQDVKPFGVKQCRRCGKFIPKSGFYETTNIDLDTDGVMCICKDCIDDLMKENIIKTSDYLESMATVCRDVDVVYDLSIAKQIIDKVNMKKLKGTYFQEYIKFIFSAKYKETGRTNRFSEQLSGTFIKSGDTETGLNILRKKWGIDFTDNDYEYLEDRYKEYVESYNPTTPSEYDTIKTLCILLLKQKEAPSDNKIMTQLKEYYNLMGISPSTLRKENRDKGARTLGVDIATMETTGPAEYIDDKKLFFDYDGLRRDILDMKRSLRNFMTGSRDFNSEGVDLSGLDVLNDIDTSEDVNSDTVKQSEGGESNGSSTTD